MPIYEYGCPFCGHEFEKIMRIKDTPPPCPSCESPEVRKKMSLSAFHLKGGGWYSDAYAGKDNKRSGGDTSKPEASASSASDGASEGKTASSDSSKAASAASSSDSSPSSGSSGSSSTTTSSAPSTSSSKADP